MDYFYKRLYELLPEGQKQSVQISFIILEKVGNRGECSKSKCFEELSSEGFDVGTGKVYLSFEAIKHKYWQLTKNI